MESEGAGTHLSLICPWHRRSQRLGAGEDIYYVLLPNKKNIEICLHPTHSPTLE